MTVRLGIGIDREGALLALPDHLPPEFRELEFSGEMLDSSTARRRVNRVRSRPAGAVGTRSGAAGAGAAGARPQKLALQLEFTKLFRARAAGRRS